MIDSGAIKILAQEFQESVTLSRETSSLNCHARMTDFYVRRHALQEACRWKWKRVQLIQKGGFR